jgi:hypothetical protein
LQVPVTASHSTVLVIAATFKMSDSLTTQRPSLSRANSQTTLSNLPALPKFDDGTQKPISTLPMPRIIFILTCGSTLLTFVILPLSLLDLGNFSYWVNPPMAVMTLLYHAGVLLIAQVPRKPNRPTFFLTIMLLACFLGVGWFVGFVTMIAVFAQPKVMPQLQAQGLPVSVAGHAIQLVAVLLECVVVMLLGAKGLLIYKRQGDPETWRPPSVEQLEKEAETEAEVRNTSHSLASLLFAEGKVDSITFDDVEVR